MNMRIVSRMMFWLCASAQKANAQEMTNDTSQYLGVATAPALVTLAPEL
jgi:hypothetical protein